MDERIVQAVKALLPEGSEVKNIFKADDGEVKAEVSMPGMGDVTCSLKKNHSGELYLD